ncbi:hypothetical protein B0A54_09886 [Friedmanniomyces endolithicus]|uniref:Glycoside hydrolase family 5 domain-containing protein n=1 Tax=Friedmanniomyces endolithicus TaxID=329885 RepID=A0A4U0USC8_9PEZI|nr:hypothetical protein B0A54_09886 [Friedmanniomyces endolithicus]
MLGHRFQLDKRTHRTLWIPFVFNSFNRDNLDLVAIPHSYHEPEVDDKHYYFAGTNAWWVSHILSDSDLVTVFSEIKNTQLQVVRVWGFGSVNTDPGPGSVFFQLLNSTGSYINYAANGIPRLDAVVSMAEQTGLKIVLNFVNNVGPLVRPFALQLADVLQWSDLGGIASYNAAFGGNATSWYTDSQSQSVYKDYIKLLVNRYHRGQRLTFLCARTNRDATAAHDQVGAAANKPVVLEEYGYGSPNNHTAVERPWQLTVLDDTSLAMDQFWQFGTTDLSGGLSDYDTNTIWYNSTAEYDVLAREHAAEMLEKAV